METQTTLPLPTGDWSFTSMSATSVSQAQTIDGSFLCDSSRMRRIFCADSLSRTIVIEFDNEVIPVGVAAADSDDENNLVETRLGRT